MLPVGPFIEAWEWSSQISNTRGIVDRIIAAHEADPFQTAVETSQDLNVGQKIF